MDESIIDMAVLGFGLSLLVGPACGALLGWRMGLEAGVALGCLIIGTAGLAAAGVSAWQRWQLVGGTEVVQGHLAGYVTERSTDGKGKVTETRAPLVAYTAPDGKPRRVKGLGGGLAGLSAGDPVEVRYRPDNPARAVVADFQNVWGVVWGMGVFGLLPTLFGLFFVGVARGEREGVADRPPPVRRDPTPGQARWRQRVTMGSNALFVGGFLVAIFYPFDDSARSLGLGFMTIGFGMLGHFIGQSIPPAMELQFRSIFGIIGTGFLVFGFGAWMMA
ncbi:MAG: DUF3592 domain-containing protein [Variovorax sp.]